MWLRILNLRKDTLSAKSGQKKIRYLDAQGTTDYLIKLLKVQQLMRKEWQKLRKRDKGWQPQKTVL